MEQQKAPAEKKIVNIPEVLKKPYLNEFEAAAVSGRAVSTLRNERHLRRGLPYLKIGCRSIRYKTEDVTAFMEGRRISFDQA
ncbi:MAG: hypothetical protein Q8K00_08315 [Syntrophales bacterium]|nr:hypothetical protein [Syntrophales bacterium]